jgi:hypothetical protein
VPFFGIGGNIGDCAIFEGQGPPNGVVPAPVGSVYFAPRCSVGHRLVRQANRIRCSRVEADRPRPVAGIAQTLMLKKKRVPTRLV